MGLIFWYFEIAARGAFSPRLFLFSPRLFLFLSFSPSWHCTRAHRTGPYCQSAEHGFRGPSCTRVHRPQLDPVHSRRRWRDADGYGDGVRPVRTGAAHHAVAQDAGLRVSVWCVCVCANAWWRSISPSLSLSRGGGRGGYGDVTCVHTRTHTYTHVHTRTPAWCRLHTHTHTCTCTCTCTCTRFLSLAHSRARRPRATCGGFLEH